MDDRLPAGPHSRRGPLRDGAARRRHDVPLRPTPVRRLACLRVGTRSRAGHPDVRGHSQAGHPVPARARAPAHIAGRPHGRRRAHRRVPRTAARPLGDRRRAHRGRAEPGKRPDRAVDAGGSARRTARGPRDPQAFAGRGQTGVGLSRGRVARAGAISTRRSNVADGPCAGCAFGGCCTKTDTSRSAICSCYGRWKSPLVPSPIWPRLSHSPSSSPSAGCVPTRRCHGCPRCSISTAPARPWSGALTAVRSRRCPSCRLAKRAISPRNGRGGPPTAAIRRRPRRRTGAGSGRSSTSRAGGCCGPSRSASSQRSRGSPPTPGSGCWPPDGGAMRRSRSTSAAPCS